MSIDPAAAAMRSATSSRRAVAGLDRLIVRRCDHAPAGQPGAQPVRPRRSGRSATTRSRPSCPASTSPAPRCSRSWSARPAPGSAAALLAVVDAERLAGRVLAHPVALPVAGHRHRRPGQPGRRALGLDRCWSLLPDHHPDRRSRRSPPSPGLRSSSTATSRWRSSAALIVVMIAAPGGMQGLLHRIGRLGRPPRTATPGSRPAIRPQQPARTHRRTTAATKQTTVPRQRHLIPHPTPHEEPDRRKVGATPCIACARRGLRSSRRRPLLTAARRL